MILNNFLQATRKHLEVILDENNRFKDYVSIVHSAMHENEIDVIFIKSQACKTERVNISDKSYMVIDRQSDLYINAIQFPEILSKDDNNKYKDDLFKSIMYIACNELFFEDHTLLAQQLHQKYIIDYNFNEPIDVIGELSRLHYVVHHEWGHVKGEKITELEQAALDTVQQIFDDHLDEITKKACLNNEWDKNIYYQTTYREQFKEHNHLECAVDFIAVLEMFSIFDENKMLGALLGGKTKYIYKSLECIYLHQVIKSIKSLVQQAINKQEYQEYESSILIQRLRVTRQIYSRLLIDHLGLDEAKRSYNEFTLFSQRVHNLLHDEIFPRVHQTIINNISLRNEINNTNAINYCMEKFKWV